MGLLKVVFSEVIVVLFIWSIFPNIFTVPELVYELAESPERGIKMSG